jgi:hypothetical protein
MFRFAPQPTFTAVVLLVALLTPAVGSSREVRGSGTGSYVQIDADEMLLANGGKVVHTIAKGTLICDDPENSMHLATQDVAGTFVYNADGDMIKGTGYADGVDLDGDTWTLHWNLNEDFTGNNWVHIDGTGKYAGIKGSGSTVNLVIHTDGRQVIRWEGTWTLKD